ncbi:polymer-forming cytoskeletal protein [Thermosediminibacter oceani]|uniref:DUF8173 domain-containing protein n=1 Tax=Thermosediminibacter oceani (strain ATCC BAA-1034 / DSM 16646 / JW/IW-1228P) TaxID=555079 RepID=D9RZR5_THEOJ|nr:polymer-forming cytoskeletal protein [Thermosediminibacter oceani]ADL08692.1 conserved hypothetical protein [Thermosediminibacter oceani DSM 16646]
MKRFLILLLAALFLLPAYALADGGYIAQMGKDLVIGPGEVLDGDAVAIMGSVIVNGKVSGDAVAVMGDVVVNGTVEGDATAVGGRVVIDKNGRVLGKTNQVGIAGGIGEMMRNPGMRGFYWNPGIMVRPFRPRTTVFNFVRFLGTLALGALAIALFPNSVRTAAQAVDKDTGNKLLKGFLIMLLTPVVALLLVFTLIGIPLIPAVIILVVAAGFFGYLAISVFLGRKLNVHLRINTNLFTEYLLGALALWLVQLVPYVGGIVSLVVFILSLGITLETRFGTKQA